MLTPQDRKEREKLSEKQKIKDQKNKMEGMVILALLFVFSVGLVLILK